MTLTGWMKSGRGQLRQKQESRSGLDVLLMTPSPTTASCIETEYLLYHVGMDSGTRWYKYIYLDIPCIYIIRMYYII